MATNQDQGGGKTRTTFETHPLYQERLEDWELMEDCYAGERRIKQRGCKYLPYTPGQRQDGVANATDEGMKDYLAYKERAIFHDVVKEAVQSMVGVMHRKDAKIKVPKKLEPLLQRCTPDGESLTSLLRKINEQQLINARIGLLVEVPTGKPVNEALPFIATYAARSVLNWDTGVAEQGERKIELVALDESAWERTGLFNWRFVEKTRVLMSDKKQFQATDEAAEPGYWACVLSEGKTEPAPSDLVQPQIGGRTSLKVPFVFVNANDLVPDPEAPPLLGLANIAIALYRNDADYQQTLFMQAQQTLVITGATDEGERKVRTGVGAVIDVPKGGDAKYIGVSADGLDAMEKRIDKLLTQASERGAKLLDFNVSGDKNASGEALKVRVAARTTTLTSIARTGAEGLKAALKLAAEWVGANPDEVEVEPNLQFADQAITGQDMVSWVSAKNQGLPISWESLHEILEQNDLTRFTYEEEKEIIDDEPPVMGAGAVPLLDANGEPMLHPETGKPLTEPAPKRGVPGTVGQSRAKPSDDESAGSNGRKKAANKSTSAGTGNQQ